VASVLYIDDEARGILQLYQAVRLLGGKAKHETNLSFKITGQNELFKIPAI